MDEPIIKCPKCGTAIKLTESLAAPIVEATREKFRQHLQNEIAKVDAREAALKDREEQFDRNLEDRIAAERTKIASEEARKARLLLETDLNGAVAENNTLKEALAVKDKKLEEAQQAHVELLRKERACRCAPRD